MQGIDISSYQAGIDLTTVPCDFTIVKATQGTGYVNPDLARAVDQALAAGKLVGVYHYIDGSTSQGEADHFWNTAGRYNGRVMWCVDWESGHNSAWGDLSYLEAFCRRLTSRCGRKLMLYASSSAFPWSLAGELGTGRWVAQYADMNPTGYQDHPWNEDAYQCEIRQYSATGRLNGWAGDLDLDKAYITREQWLAYTTNEGADVQLTDTITRPDGHQGSVEGILGYLDQRIEALYNIVRPDGKTVDLATIAAYNDQRLERLEAIIAGRGLRKINPDGSESEDTTDLATEARWAGANVARILQSCGVTDEQIEKIRRMIADAKVQITVVGPTPAVEGGDAA